MFKTMTQRGLDIRLSGVVILLTILMAVAAFSSGGGVFRDTQAALVAFIVGLFLVVAVFGIQIHRTAAHTGLGIFLLIALAASATSVWQMESLQEVGLVAGYFLIFLLASNVIGSNRLRLAAHLIVLAGVVVASVGLYQHLIGNVKQLELLRLGGHALEARQLAAMIDRAFANFVSANSFAGFLVLSIPVAIGLFLYERDVRLRTWTAFAMVT
ncbi:MAG TPA: hypothetical protein ENI11_02005, partial [Actinobacteria bacterium]|nr:hypothetical protein [Actinomycetota bacterium]